MNLTRTLRRWAVLGTMAGVVAAGLLSRPLPVHADPPPASPQPPSASSRKTISELIPADAAALMRAQAPYLEAADKIRRVVDTDPAGFAGTDYAGDALDVWWKGPLPARIRQVISQQPVAIVVKSAPHSRQELRAVAARLGAAMKADPDSSLFAVQLPVDGSHVIAMFAKDSTAKLVDGRKGTMRTSSGPAARSISLNNSAGIRVELREGERVEARCGPPTRYNDGWEGDSCRNSSFSGGAAIRNIDNGTKCTAGFGVRDSSGRRYLLTAGHCGRPGGGWDNGERSRYIGNVTRERVDHDLMLIATNSDSFMWDGGPFSTWGKTVSGYKGVIPGMTVCQSGSSSGVQCNIMNSNDLTYQYCDRDVYSNWECYNDLVYSTRSNGTPPSAGGDSGGPVFVLNGVGSVWAVGIVSGGSDHTLLYQDFVTANRDFGVTTIE